MNRQGKNEHDALSQHVLKLFEIYGKEPNRDAIEGYIVALSNLSVWEMDEAFPEATRRKDNGYAPTPGEIMAIVKEIRENAVPEREIQCPKCKGTRWRVIMRSNPKLPYPERKAVPCDCLPEDRLEAAGKWVKSQMHGVTS